MPSFRPSPRGESHDRSYYHGHRAPLCLRPHPDPIEDTLYRLHIIFEEPDGRLWSSGTDLMAPNMESADALAENLNRRLGLDYTAWTAFARKVFAARRALDRDPDSQPSGPAG